MELDCLALAAWLPPVRALFTPEPDSLSVVPLSLSAISSALLLVWSVLSVFAFWERSALTDTGRTSLVSPLSSLPCLSIRSVIFLPVSVPFFSSVLPSELLSSPPSFSSFSSFLNSLILSIYFFSSAPIAMARALTLSEFWDFAEMVARPCTVPLPRKDAITSLQVRLMATAAPTADLLPMA